MGTRAENEEYEGSCWNNAGEDEQMFILLGRDRHAPALIRLWAEMREREGEDPNIVTEARDIAQLMEDAAVANGRVTLSLDAVSAFAVTLKQPIAPAEPTQAQPSVPYTAALREGEIVCAGRGRPAKLVRIFGDDKDTPKEVRGMANIQVPGHGPATVSFEVLRRATPEEIEVYQNTGGRL